MSLFKNTTSLFCFINYITFILARWYFAITELKEDLDLSVVLTDGLVSEANPYIILLLILDSF